MADFELFGGPARGSEEGGAELRSERSFSLPPPDAPKPPRRRTQEYPSATSSRKNSSESESVTPVTAYGHPFNYYDPAYTASTSATASAPFWNPHTDHPLSHSEQQDVLDRVRNDLLGVSLESIKGPLRQLASLGDNAPAMQSSSRPVASGMTASSNQAQPMQPPPRKTPPTTLHYYNPLVNGDDIPESSERKTTVSPQEAFLDYDDTVKHAPSNLFGSLPSPSLLSNARALPHSPSQQVNKPLAMKKGQSAFSVPDNAVSWRMNSNGNNSASSSAEDDELPTPPTLAGRSHVAPPSRPQLVERSTSSSSSSQQPAAPSPSLSNSNWEEWTTGPLPPPLPGFAPPPPPRTYQVESASDEFVAPAPPARNRKGGHKGGKSVDPPPRKARLAAKRKYAEYDLGNDSSSDGSSNGDPPYAFASTSAAHGPGSLENYANGADAGGAPEEIYQYDEDDYEEEEEDDYDFGGGGSGSGVKRKKRDGDSSPRKRHHGAHPSHSAGDIVCQVPDGNGVPCGTIFRRPYDLNRHMATIHGVGAGPKKEWRCRVCDTVFSRKDALMRHSRTSKHKQ